MRLSEVVDEALDVSPSLGFGIILGGAAGTNGDLDGLLVAFAALLVVLLAASLVLSLSSAEVSTS